MGMTVEERHSKQFIETLLSKQGYPTYARLLHEFDLNLTNSPTTIAFMEPGKGRIVVNRNLNVDQVSTIIRHEILHQYLQHENRLIKELAKDIGVDPDDIDDNTLQELSNKLYSSDDFNIAGDYEISNRGYTEADKDIARSIELNGQILTGLVTEDQHPEWVDLSIEEMYRELQKEKKKDPQQPPPPGPSEPPIKVTNEVKPPKKDNNPPEPPGPPQPPGPPPKIIHGTLINGRFYDKDNNDVTPAMMVGA